VNGDGSPSTSGIQGGTGSPARGRGRFATHDYRPRHGIPVRAGVRWVAVVALVALVFGGGWLVTRLAHVNPVNVREQEWWLDPLKIPQAQQLTRGEGVTVALVDSGVDPTRPDLAGQLLPGTTFGEAPPSPLASTDPRLHGTEMAGLIAGKGGGATHLLGIAPGAKILPIMLVMDSDGKYFARDTDEAIRWAADHGAKVINLSLGRSGAASPLEVDAIRYAFSKDAVVVAAAGNVSDDDRDGNVIAPANIPGVVAVAGTAPSGAWDGATHGPEVVVAAPAAKLISTVPTAYHSNGFDVVYGTSGATAITSGVVALIRSRYPQLDAANVINRLIRTAKDEGTPGRDPIFGFGTIRPLEALTLPVPPVSSNPLLTGVSAPR